jgi:hypothetical protein
MMYFWLLTRDPIQIFKDVVLLVITEMLIMFVLG